MTGNKRLNERAVSETVGFILIFGIVMAGIGLVTLFGYPALLSQQANANIQNMEKNMIVLQNDLNSLTYKNVPYQETTMQVAGGTLYVENPNPDKSFIIKNGTSDVISNFQPGEIAFRSDTENVIMGLQNGAVVKWQLGGAIVDGSTVLAPPRWYYDSSTGTLVITLIQIYSDSTLAQTGIGTISMSVSELYPLIEQENPGTVTIEYNDYEHDYYTAWKNYFNEFAPTSSGIVSISGVNRLVIKSYKVKIISI